jgi:hypothetical protein
VLSNVVFDTKTGLGDIQWSGVGAVNLTRIDWDTVPTIGDEYEANEREIAQVGAAGAKKRRKTQAELLEGYQAAVRAYRQLAIQLNAQGLSEAADRFDYRSQLWQRRVLRRRGHPGRAFGLWLLDLVAGYGYKPMRSIITYLLVVTLFGLAYWMLGLTTGHTLTWNEAGVVSLTAFHGRGFFPTAFSPGDPQAALAAVEAVIGLLIEITFIATFTQRFLGK